MTDKKKTDDEKQTRKAINKVIRFQEFIIEEFGAWTAVGVLEEMKRSILNRD